VAKTDRYQRLNSLSHYGLWMMLLAWPDAPPPLILLENVERITQRSREWLDAVIGMLRTYGYAVQETTHDCGAFGGLAQHRKRYMLVARHIEQCSDFLQEPPEKPVLGIGDVIGNLPVPYPEQPEGGPMHHLPRLSAMNWLRLACIPAGGDYRDLPDEVQVCDGYRGRYGIVPWLNPSPCVRANHEVRLAPAAVADPRLGCDPRATAYGVRGWDDSSHVVLGHACHDNSAVAIADPRVNCYRREGGHGVKGWDQASTAVIAHPVIHNHPCSVADPRIGYSPRRDSYGVASMDEPAKTVRAVQKHQNGVSSVADGRLATPTHRLSRAGGKLRLVGPRIDLESRQSADPVPVIRAPDGTWHRPLTTLELAAIQGFPTRLNGEWLELAGNSHKAWRERIGNAIPPPAAEAIARECAATLEHSSNGEWRLASTSVWVDRKHAGNRT
jgi:site-specific DNA-cytosine methylase